MKRFVSGFRSYILKGFVPLISQHEMYMWTMCDPLNLIWFKANHLSPINHGCQTNYSCAAFWVLGWQKAKEISRWQLAGCKSWIQRSLTRSPKRGQSPKPSMPPSVLLIGLRSNAALSNTLWSCIQSLLRWFLTASYGASHVKTDFWVSMETKLQIWTTQFISVLNGWKCKGVSLPLELLLPKR